MINTNMVTLYVKHMHFISTISEIKPVSYLFDVWLPNMNQVY